MCNLVQNVIWFPDIIWTSQNKANDKYTIVKYKDPSFHIWIKLHLESCSFIHVYTRLGNTSQMFFRPLSKLALPSKVDVSSALDFITKLEQSAGQWATVKNKSGKSGSLSAFSCLLHLAPSLSQPRARSWKMETLDIFGCRARAFWLLLLLVQFWVRQIC